MHDVLAEIQDGSFARSWIAENDSGRRELRALREADRDHQIEQVGAELRAQMAFLNPVDGPSRPGPGRGRDAEAGGGRRRPRGVGEGEGER